MSLGQPIFIFFEAGLVVTVHARLRECLLTSSLHAFFITSSDVTLLSTQFLHLPSLIMDSKVNLVTSVSILVGVG